MATTNPTPIPFEPPVTPQPGQNVMPSWPSMPFTNIHQLNLDWGIHMIKAYGDYLLRVQQALSEWTGSTNELLQQLIDEITGFKEQFGYIIGNLPPETVDELLKVLETVTGFEAELQALRDKDSEQQSQIDGLQTSLANLQATLSADIQSLQAALTTANEDIVKVQQNLEAYTTSNDTALASVSERVEKNRQDILTLTGGEEGALSRINELEAALSANGITQDSDLQTDITTIQSKQEREETRLDGALAATAANKLTGESTTAGTSVSVTGTSLPPGWAIKSGVLYPKVTSGNWCMGIIEISIETQGEWRQNRIGIDTNKYTIICCTGARQVDSGNTDYEIAGAYRQNTKTILTTAMETMSVSNLIVEIMVWWNPSIATANIHDDITLNIEVLR